MASNNINIKVNTQAKMAKQSLHDLSKQFVVLGRDGKRANSSILGLTSSLGGMSKVIKGIGIYKLGQALAKATQSAMDIGESIHMYNIAMGEFAESTGEAVVALSELTGMDKVKMLDTVGEFNMLARSMGVTDKNASVLSESTNRLALDLSALTNRSYTKVAEDLRSGLIGQSKTMYKYGIDVTEAAIKQEALNQGITKSVRHMSQGEKMALRYAVMIKTSGLAHGDFANTIDRPANQLRVLSDRMLTLTRTIGSIFMPALAKILPYLNAVAKVLNRIFGIIARLAGYNKEVNEKIENTSSSVGGGMEDIGVGADSSGKKVDKLKKKIQALAGFDELNILGSKQADTPSSGGGGGGGDGGGFDMDFGSYDSMLDGLQSEANKIAERIEAKLAEFGQFMKPTTDAFKELWNEGLSKLMSFTYDNLMNFLNSFLIPMSKWALGDGLIRFFNITNDLLNSINWDVLLESLNRMYEALVPFGTAIGEGLLDFYEFVLKPISTWVMNVALVELADAISDGLESIDYESIRNGFNGLWESLTPFTINIGEGLLWFLTEVLIPLGVWAMDTLLSPTLELLASALDVINATIEALKPLGLWLWEEFLKPMAEWTGGIIISVLENLKSSLYNISSWISNNEGLVRGMTVTTLAFMGAWEVTKILGFIQMSGGLISALNLITKAIFGGIGAKLIDKVETVYLTALYAGDFIKSIINTALKVGESTALWVANTVQLVASKLAIVAQTVVTKAWSAVTVTATAVGKAFGAVIAFLTSPMGLVVVAIGAMIAIGVLLYKNWDEVKEFGKKAWDNIKGIFDTFSKWLSGVFATDWSKSFGGFGDILNAFSKNASNIVDGIKKVFEGIMKFLKGAFTRDWEMMWQGLADIMKGIAGTFVAIMKAPLNGVIGLMNGAISGLNKIKVPDWVGGSIGGKGINMPKIPLLARGGQVGMGQMFVAGEAGAELIGSHQGKTTVMPLENSGFVNAMHDAVFNAVASAMGGSDGGGVVVNIGERTIVDTMVDGMNRQNRINGRTVITI